MAASAGEPKSLPLILARELGSNLATPMFLIDAGGTLVFYNEAAELLIEVKGGDPPELCERFRSARLGPAA